jgi:hypothetical protein
LEHPRRIDVCERRNSVRGRANVSNELAGRGMRCRAIAIGRHPATEEVSVIENVEAFQPEQEAGVI